MGSQNTILIEDYFAMLDLRDKNPDVFKCADMGIINYLIFKHRALGNIRVFDYPYQFLIPESSKGNQRRLVQYQQATQPHRRSVCYSFYG